MYGLRVQGKNLNVALALLLALLNFDTEYGRIAFVRNVGKVVSDRTGSHPTRVYCLMLAIPSCSVGSHPCFGMGGGWPYQ
jgi:hypothetical protein